jgi:hypothetical protein
VNQTKIGYYAELHQRHYSVVELSVELESFEPEAC